MYRPIVKLGTRLCRVCGRENKNFVKAKINHIKDLLLNIDSTPQLMER